MESLESDKLERECNSLDKIAILLIGRGLMTEDERRIIAANDTLEGKRAAIYQVLLEKSSSEVSSIMKILKYFHSNGYFVHYIPDCKILDSQNDVDRIQNTDANNPLLNNTVIKHVFQYLDVASILRCRSVCRKWNDVADPFIRKLARINLDSLRPDTFVNIFKNSMPTLPFTSFLFSNIENLPTTSTSTTSTIEYFFDNWKQNIKVISWKNTIINEGGKKIDRYDISRWISISENLVELQVLGNAQTTEIQICLSSLQKIKLLDLRGCRILLDKSVKIAPLILSLREITFCRARDSAQEGTPNGTETVALNEMYLNHIISLTQVKEITFGNLEDIPATLLKLYVDKEVVKIEKLKIHRVFISTWMERLNWEFDSLFLSESPPATKMQVKVNELVVDLTNVDFSQLPESIQKLSFFRYKGTKFSCSEPLCLPNLKHLFVDVDAEDFTLEFHDFLLCLSTLEEITLVDTSGSLKAPLHFNLNVIPDSVKAMKFNFPVVSLAQEKILNLDKLILQKLTLSQAHDTLKNIMPKVLILEWKKQNNFEINDSVLLFVKSNPNLEKIVIGEFDWCSWKFSESQISQCVDKQSKYYEFTKGQGVGIAISREKFYGMLKLYSGAFYNE